jgi:hypothetical protein
MIIIEFPESETASPQPQGEGIVQPRVHMTPDGRMLADAAAKYLNRSPHTLKNWRYRKTGPPYTTMNRTIFYYKSDLDRFIAGQR